MEAYLRAFINIKQNNWVRLLLMAEFAYNNVKNMITDPIYFKFNCSYYPHVFFEDKINFCSKSRSADKLAKKLKNLRVICQQNLLHT